ncbi:hypothetical protein ACE0DR_25800 [Azotobacter sp. CWF10]
MPPVNSRITSSSRGDWACTDRIGIGWFACRDRQQARWPVDAVGQHHAQGLYQAAQSMALEHDAAGTGGAHRCNQRRIGHHRQRQQARLREAAAQERDQLDAVPEAVAPGML